MMESNYVYNYHHMDDNYNNKTDRKIIKPIVPCVYKEEDSNEMSCEFDDIFTNKNNKTTEENNNFYIIKDNINKILKYSCEKIQVCVVFMKEKSVIFFNYINENYINKTNQKVDNNNNANNQINLEIKKPILSENYDPNKYDFYF